MRSAASDISWAATAQQNSPEPPQAVVPASPVLEHQSGYAPRLVPASLTDSSSAFVINWFQEVCPAWSGFDSDANWNRKIAIDLWQTSATVKSALESMSASFLASRLPSLRQASLRLMSRATEVIQAELEVVKNQQVLCTIPTGVLFAMFCMGTTICWVDSRCLGLPFFRELRALLRRLNSQPSTAWSSSSRELLEYFNQSMVYCEMLLAVVSVDQQKADPVEDDQTTQQSGLDLARTGGNIMLHPWTGVSMLSSRLFAESIRLCRTSRSRVRQPAGVQMALTAILGDLLQAQGLEEKLLALEINSEQHFSDTGDLATPESHLAMVAEAYRVSALLHLYQTFPELAFQRLPATGTAPNDTTLWHDWIVPLTLHLVKTLEQIPPSSGTRVMQPLLYISASTGLRHSPGVPHAPFDPFASFPLDVTTTMCMDGWGWRTQSQAPIHEADNLTSYVAQITSSGQALLPDLTSDLDLQISRARHFVMKRLGILESSLPPAPIVVAKELVSTIWNSYDNDAGGMYLVHWIDVMELNDLRSMFG